MRKFVVPMAMAAASLLSSAAVAQQAAAPAPSPVTGNVTLDRSYRGGIILFDSASGGTITLPATLPAGFNVSVIQINAGQATIAAGAGAVLQSQQSFTKTAGQWAMLGIVAYDVGSFVLVGNGA